MAAPTTATDRPSLHVAQTILAQLGGHHFKVMTGVTNLGGSAGGTAADPLPYLRMNLAAEDVTGGLEYLFIYLQRNGLYRLEFFRVHGLDSATPLERFAQVTYENAYSEDLQPIFTAVTGMYTHL